MVIRGGHKEGVDVKRERGALKGGPPLDPTTHVHQGAATLKNAKPQVGISQEGGVALGGGRKERVDVKRGCTVLKGRTSVWSCHTWTARRRA